MNLITTSQTNHAQPPRPHAVFFVPLSFFISKSWQQNGTFLQTTGYQIFTKSHLLKTTKNGYTLATLFTAGGKTTHYHISTLSQLVPPVRDCRII